MKNKDRTSVAVLGTLAEFHHEPIPYDISALLALVTQIYPDLLCLDMTATRWREQNFADLPLNYRDALLRLANQTDIVVVPIGSGQLQHSQRSGGWRSRAVALLRKGITAVQRTAPGPDAINQGWRHNLVNDLYLAIRLLSDRGIKRGIHDYTDRLTQDVLRVSRRDPAARVLVIVNVQYCHLIRNRLKKYDEIKVTDYADL